MEVTSRTVSQLFQGGGDVHYVLPHFQRQYAWEKENWKTLLDDIFEVYEVYQDTSPPEHFMGAIVVINDGTRNGTVTAHKLVDGQQRLTTLSILLCAFAELSKDKYPELHRKARRFLVNQDEKGELYYKLSPTEKYGDRATYQAIVAGKPNERPTESKIDDAYRYFSDELAKKLFRAGKNVEQFFFVVVNCLHVVFINLEQREKPYEIFESLNAKGKPLSQADLVRNYIAMRLPGSEQVEVFKAYWSPIENMLREDRRVASLGELSAFLRHDLALQFGNIPNSQHIYARFRDRMERDFRTPEAFIAELKRLHRYAVYYDMFVRPNNVNDEEIANALHRLNTIEATTAYPLMLSIFSDYETGVISRDDLMECLGVIENYLMRRYLAGEPTNYTKNMFPSASRDLQARRYVESLKGVLLTKNYPSDAQIRQALMTRDLYEGSNKQPRLVLVLSTLNRHLSRGSGGYTALDSSPTVEHIMPQTLTSTWRAMLGKNADEVHQTYLHTLGNLTLVTREWNSELSNSSFANKLAKFRQHALRLNADYFATHDEVWDESAIQRRAEALIALILEVWQAMGESQKQFNDHTRKKPSLVILLGDEKPVTSWRDVTFVTCEMLLNLVSKEEFVHMSRNTAMRLAPERPTFDPKSGHWRQLSNGWWAYLNWSANDTVALCKQMVSACDLAEEDWQVITE